MSTSLRSTVFTIVILAAVLVLPLGAMPGKEFPPPDPNYAPPVFSEPEITLDNAIRLTLEYEPLILIQTEGVDAQLGIVQQATGQFDLSLNGTISYELIREELTAGEKLDQQDKRDDLRTDIADAQEDVDRAEQQIAQIDETTGYLEGGGDPSNVNLSDPLLQSQYEILVAAYEAAPPEDQAEALQNIIDWLEDRRTLLVADRDVAAGEAYAGRESLRNLGVIAEDYQSQTGNLRLELFKQYRTGITFAPFVDLSGDSYDWVGKPKNQDYGGPGGTDNYTSSVGFSFVIPFGRGRGVDSTGAPEKAAKIDYDATRSALTHTSATSVFNTMVQYWEVVAAQRTLDVQESSLELQVRLREMVEALVEGDEIPRSEISRMKAREAEVEALVEDARRQLREARVALASIIGLSVEQSDQAPLAADDFPDFPTEDQVAGLAVVQLADKALARRYDLLSSQQLESSGKVLWKAAAIDVAPIVDLDLKVSYSGLEEGGSVIDGIDGSLFGSWTGPSARIGVNYEHPVGNNLQLGRLQQQTAEYRRRVINSRNLARLIRANVVKAAATLEEALAQLSSFQTASDYYQVAVDNELEKLRYGRSTLIDTITTQKRQVDATLALVSSEKTVAQLLALLRYESGTIVVEGPGHELQIASDLLSLPEPNGNAGIPAS